MLQRLSDHQVVVNQHISKHSIVWLNSYLQLKLQEKFYIEIKISFDPKYSKEKLRTNVGMVFQQPNPFPKSIYDNITYGPKTHGIKTKSFR